MSKGEKKVKEIVPPGSPLLNTNNPNLPTAPIPQGPKLKCGYRVGLLDDGSLVFNIVGDEPGVVELLGLHSIAKERLEARLSDKMGGRIGIALERLDELVESIFEEDNGKDFE